MSSGISRDEVVSARWKRLLRNLISDAPPHDMKALYVEPPKLKELLLRRFRDAEVDPKKYIDGDILQGIVTASGGLPRDALAMTCDAVERALRGGAERLTVEHVETAVRKRAEDLATGLTSEDWDTLLLVRRRGDIPVGERAARLLADGRILRHPPQGSNSSARFLVHPALEQEIERRMAAHDGECGIGYMRAPLA